MNCLRIVLVIGVLVGGNTELHAQATLYDNLHILDECSAAGGECWSSVTLRDVRFAQQFLMNGNTTVDEVTVQLARTGENVAGSLSVELWADDGVDNPLLPANPDAKIADIGQISDVTDMPMILTNYTFDDPIVGLEANEKYWIIVNFEGLNGPLSMFNSIGWGHTLWPLRVNSRVSDLYMETQGAGGTSGAATMRATKKPYNGWDDLARAIGSETGHFVMSVRTGSDLISGDFDGNGLLDTADVDLLTAQVAAESPHDPAFDLSGDGTVNDDDIDQWLSDAAIHNRFSEAYLYGDSNLDGSVNATDLNNLALHWQQDMDKWSRGDFTADGVVNAVDLNALALNWRHSIAVASSATAPVPEPSALALALSIAGLAMFWRR